MFKNVCAIVIAILLTTSVYAEPLASAKAYGKACEHTDGYLRDTQSGDRNSMALVKNVNAKRKEKYTKIASKKGVTVDQVAMRAAQKLINKAPQYACK